jgi:cysteine desulfurase/selenocysteine lyase
MDNIKHQFPTLHNAPDLAYFDSAASTQTHSSVSDVMNHYYDFERCNIHRGDYEISRSVSDKVDVAREQVAELINAKPEQIIFTQGATEGMNMIAEWFKNVPTVFITELEHSANVMPWLAQGRNTTNSKLQVIPTHIDGDIDLSELARILEKNQGALVSIIATSNVSGSDTPWSAIARIAKSCGCPVVVDACQTIGSHKIDVSANPDVDFLVFSGHKMFGPTGIGALYSRHDVNELRPVKLGGGPVQHYDVKGSIVFHEGPEKHEPGTPNVAGMLGLGVAAEWINYIGYDTIAERIRTVNGYLVDAGLYDVKGLSCVNKQLELATASYTNIASFVSRGAHPSDIGALLGSKGVAVRTGKVCAHHIVNKLSNYGILRVSWSIYNTKEDADKLVGELCNTMKKLA